jgi:hypothetical protein
MIIKVIGVDPGQRDSAYVILEKKQGNEWVVQAEDILENSLLRDLVRAFLVYASAHSIYIVIEKMVNYNQKVGASTFDTIEWIGRFKQSWEHEAHWLEIESMPRRAAVGHLCEFGKSGSDKYVREALIKRFGDPGTEAAPGVLYGFSNHLWSALAIAVTYVDKFLKTK